MNLLMTRYIVFFSLIHARTLFVYNYSRFTGRGFGFCQRLMSHATLFHSTTERDVFLLTLEPYNLFITCLWLKHRINLLQSERTFESNKQTID